MLLSCFLGFTVLAVGDMPQYPNQPWPLPKAMGLGNRTVVVSPNVTLACSARPGCDPRACEETSIISRAFMRAVPRLSPRTARLPRPAEGVAHRVIVCVRGTTSDEAPLLPGPTTNESYHLRVPATSRSGRSSYCT